MLVAAAWVAQVASPGAPLPLKAAIVPMAVSSPPFPALLVPAPVVVVEATVSLDLPLPASLARLQGAAVVTVVVARYAQFALGMRPAQFLKLGHHVRLPLHRGAALQRDWVDKHSTGR